MILPTRDYRRRHVPVPPTIHEGLDQAAHGVAGVWRRAHTRTARFERLAGRVVDGATQWREASDARLRQCVADLATRFRRQRRADQEALLAAFEAVVAVAERTLGLRPHPVQVLGALALHEGCLIEMATGEGKSLTACLAGAIAAWTGRPCHVITVNDYLADRDAQEMRPFYDFCGVTVGCVTDTMEDTQRREQHCAGIVYTTSHQLLADFLRDRLKMGVWHDPQRRLIRGMLEHSSPEDDGLVMRGIDFALVDEADSVLIDEAVTPLIISAASENRPLIEASDNAVKIASTLVENVDYVRDSRYRDVRLTDDGLSKIENASTSLDGIWKGSPRRLELVTHALLAREFYQRDRQYVVSDGKVVIVDDFTGRMMPDRNWSHGLHQAIEAKEGVEVTSPTETLARLSFQRFFRLFRRLCGMSGTALEARGELWHIYELPLVLIPTHRPCRRLELPDAVYADASTKLDAIVASIRDVHRTGRPVLVGTRSIRASEDLARRLGEASLECQVLNATRHKEEAQIIARAGQPGQITIATNMAGRGTDIKLGPGIGQLGGLHVIATERNESLRIDRQLFGRCARQGDPGSAQAFVSPGDELMRRFVPERVRGALAHAVRHSLPLSPLMARATVAWAQSTCQSLAYRQRKDVLQTDEWLEEALSFTTPTVGL